VSNTKASDRCGAPTRLGRRCPQVTDVWPCRYHDAAAFNAVLTSLAATIRDCGGWGPFLRRAELAASLRRDRKAAMR
jgi:hypothetical protein